MSIKRAFRGKGRYNHNWDHPRAGKYVGSTASAIWIPLTMRKRKKPRERRSTVA